MPAAAILPGEEGGTTVLTVDDTGRRAPEEGAARRHAKATRCRSSAGSRAGERVVTVGGIGLDDKAKVRVVEAAAKKRPKSEEDDDKTTRTKK